MATNEQAATDHPFFERCTDPPCTAPGWCHRVLDDGRLCHFTREEHMTQDRQEIRLPNALIPKQPPPVNLGVEIPQQALEWFAAILGSQTEWGKTKYGDVLHTHNGRDASQDALEELADAVVYVTQLGIERRDLLAANTRLRTAVALLDSMIKSGESHSTVSEAIVQEALEWPPRTYTGTTT